MRQGRGAFAIFLYIGCTKMHFPEVNIYPTLKKTMLEKTFQLQNVFRYSVEYSFCMFMSCQG